MPNPVSELVCALRGHSFLRGPALQALLRLEPGQAVRLVRAPDNVHDPFAVAIHFAGLPIGWVPKELNRDLAQAIDAGATATAVCTRQAVRSERGRITTEAMVRITWGMPQ